MARRKGIFSRLGSRRREPADAASEWTSDPEEDQDPATETHAAPTSRESRDDTEDWAPPFELEEIDPGSDEPAPSESAEEDLDVRLRNAESRAEAAEARAERAAQERDDAEERIGALSEQLQRERDRQATAAGQGQNVGAAAADDDTTEERIGRIEADAEERIRTEVAVARKAAEERFGEELAAREREFEHERGQKVQLIEDSDRRLSEIEEQALEAGDRLTLAERRLSDEAERLRSDAETEAAAVAERAREEATKIADSRVQERELELEESIERSEQAERETAERVAEAERRAEDAEAAAARVARESRLAATNWLQSQAKALRREGERSGEARVAGRAEPEPAPPEPTGAGPESREGDDRVSLASADFEQLLGAGLSAAQARRVIRYREDRGLDSVADLEQVPGFPRSFLESLSARLRD